jgi:hypothetical protein
MLLPTLLWLAAPGAIAQQGDDDRHPPIYYESARAGDSSAPTLVRASATPLQLRSSSTAPNAPAQRAPWRAQLLEVPREHVQPGQYSRPRYALGFHSYTMRRWLNDLGFEAQSCLAPVVRLRTRISSDFHISGTLWIQARCAFH